MSTSRPRASSSRRSRPSVSSRLARPVRRPGRVLLLLAFLLVPVHGVEAAPSLDEALGQLEAAYRRVTDLKAGFQQTAVNRAMGQTIEARGTLYLKRPGKLRWEYATPIPQEVISDGKRLWVYTPELGQVNVSDAPEALAGPAGSFLQGLGQVREHFQARFLNPAQPAEPDGGVVLDLTPRQPRPLLARLVVSVDPKTWLVRTAVLHDELGNTVTVRFGAPVVNSGLADTLFTFVPPPGVVVVPTPGLRP
jgi:outer membrane lipoprotein carrier protein